jgi:Ca2+-binding RTX toxin-like protein
MGGNLGPGNTSYLNDLNITYTLEYKDGINTYYNNATLYIRDQHHVETDADGVTKLIPGHPIEYPTIFFGANGDDTIHGNSGKDVIYGGGGNDTLWGHEGDDIFAWKLADMHGKATIEDFRKDGHDVLRFDDLFSDSVDQQAAFAKWVEDAIWDFGPGTIVGSLFDGDTMLTQIKITLGATTTVDIETGNHAQQIVLTDFSTAHIGGDHTAALDLIQEIIKVGGGNA